MINHQTIGVPPTHWKPAHNMTSRWSPSTGCLAEADYLLYHGFTMPQKWSEITPLWRSNPFVVNWWSTMVVCAIFIFNSNKESPILSYMDLKSSPKVCYWAYWYHIIVIPILIMFILYIYVYMYMYIYVYICICICICDYTYINRSKSRWIAWTYSQVPLPCFHKNL